MLTKKEFCSAVETVKAELHKKFATELALAEYLGCNRMGICFGFDMIDLSIKLLEHLFDNDIIGHFIYDNLEVDSDGCSEVELALPCGNCKTYWIKTAAQLYDYVVACGKVKQHSDKTCNHACMR